MSAAQFSEAAMRAWRWPLQLSVSEWAERYRVLAPGVTPEPGPWNNDRTPYLRGIMDAVRENGVEEIVYVKPTQVGGSEAVRNILGFWIDQEPGPCLWVLPDEKSAKDAIDERIKPLLDASPRLRRHLTDRVWDVKQSRIRLDTMDIFVGWAGSPQSLASRPCRYVVFDETDKYKEFSGREADPISLGTERTKTFGHRRRILKLSTPTVRDGAIWKAFEACGDKRRLLVPCPHCGHFQRLVWPRVRYAKLDLKDRALWADRVENEHLAWYECERCSQRIDDRQRLGMIDRGVWASQGQNVLPDGKLDCPRPQSRSVGFHMSSLYSPWTGFAAMASLWIRADGDPGKTQNFYNGWQAEPIEVQVAQTRPSVIHDKAINGPPKGLIPPWAQMLIATADTQRDHFYYTVRSWGFEYKSQLIDFGLAYTFDELYAKTLGTQFPFSDGRGFGGASCLLIDSGGGGAIIDGLSRTGEVYQFCLRDPARIFPIKGSSRSLNFVVTHHWQKELSLQLWEIDTEKAKDQLSLLITDSNPERWMACQGATEDYCAQMASEHKILDPKTRKPFWTTKTSGAPNHYFDCETYQTAAAMWFGAGQPLPQPAQPMPIQQAQSPFMQSNGPGGADSGGFSLNPNGADPGVSLNPSVAPGGWSINRGW